jgi:hypothetical protein
LIESTPNALSYRKERKVCAKAAKENGYQHFYIIEYIYNEHFAHLA